MRRGASSSSTSAATQPSAERFRVFSRKRAPTLWPKALVLHQPVRDRARASVKRRPDGFDRVREHLLEREIEFHSLEAVYAGA